MLNKIVFLCADPWEHFLMPASQSYSKHYYEWFKKLLTAKKVKLRCREYIDIYGTSNGECEADLFWEKSENLQLLYVQSDRRELLEKIFQTADLVIAGLPGSRKEFEKIYMTLFPWQDEILFLWGSHIGRDIEYIHRLVRECMLKREQFIKVGEELGEIFGVKKLPLFCGSLKSSGNYS